MKTNMKVLRYFIFVSCFLIALSSAQRKSNEPIGQGRTLGLIRPLLNLGLNGILRPLAGNDAPIVAVIPHRPALTSEAAESDSYYGYNGYYGGYAPHYNAYNYYGGYPLYRPTFGSFAFPFYGGYRPQVYPGYFSALRPSYSNARPSSIAQRPSAGHKPATYPSIATTSSTANGITNPAANSAQASQIANLLGQLLGQQLRPLLNQGATSPTRDNRGIAPSNYADKRYRGRYYQG